MPNPQIFGAGQMARFAAISAQERENCYVEWLGNKPGEADRGKQVILGFPGLTLFGYYGALPCRGWRAVPPYLYAVFGNTLYQIDNNGVATAIAGALLTNGGRVAMADNGTQLMLADNPNGYILQLYGASAATGQVPANGLVKIAAAGFLGARDVTYLDNAFVVAVPGSNPITSQQWQQSNLGDGTGWNGLAFDLADTFADPLIGLKGYAGMVHLFGTYSTEFWQNLGLAIFQFGRNPGTTAMIGLAAVGSVAELAAIPLGGTAMDALGVLGQARDGLVAPYLLAKGQYIGIGTPDIVSLLNGIVTGDVIGQSYEIDQHRFYGLTFPTAGLTLAYDTLSGMWSKRKSYAPLSGLGAWRGGLAVQFNGQTLFADPNDGTVYAQPAAMYTQAGGTFSQNPGVPLTEWSQAAGRAQPHIRRVTAQHLFASDDPLITDALELDISQGVGLASGQGSAPVALLEISRDKGKTWIGPAAAPMGPMGATRQRCRWRKLGRARDTTYRVTVSDPVPFLITGEDLRMRQGKSGGVA